MRCYRVRHNFTRYAPTKWVGGYVRDFGLRNEGFTVTADSVEDALRKVERGGPEVIGASGAAILRGLNPFYLTVTAER
jgi:hypothetical protein